MRIIANARLLYHVKGLRAAVRYVVRAGVSRERLLDVLGAVLFAATPCTYVALYVARHV